MWNSNRDDTAGVVTERLTGYTIDLELEVDRLRKQIAVVQQAAERLIGGVQMSCEELDERGVASPEIKCLQALAGDFGALLNSLHLGEHPARDFVAEIAMRPLVNLVFLWHQRVLDAQHVQLNLDLEVERVIWFPARLRHMLENLISNAIRYRDAEKGETRVLLGLRASSSSYELRMSDNGKGMSPESLAAIESVGNRSLSPQAWSVGVGLPVVKWLVEQSGGQCLIDSTKGKGTSIVLTLPRFDVADFLL